MRQSTWFSDSFLVLLVTLMRYAWLWPWFEVVRRFLSPQYTGELLAPWQLIVLPLLAFGLTRWGAGAESEDTAETNQGAAGPSWAGRLLVAALGLLVLVGVLWWQLYAAQLPLWDMTWLQRLGDQLIHWDINLGLPAPLIAGLFLMVLWLNGLNDAVRVMTHDDIWAGLLRGIIALVLYLALFSRRAAGLPADLFPQVVLLFTAGMVALAFSSLKITMGLDRALGLGQRRVSSSPALSRYWLISVTVTVATLVGGGLGLGALIAPEQLARLLTAIQLVVNTIGRVIGTILLWIGYLLFLVAYYIALLLEPLIRRLFTTLEESPLMELAGLPEDAPTMQEVVTNPTVIPDSYRWLALAVFVLVVLVLFALAVRRLRTTPATAVDEVRESILTADLLQDQLASLWERWFGRRQGEADPFLSLAGEEEARRRVRTLYQQLLARATALGQGRRPAATPTEYQHAVQLPATDVAAPLAALTTAYHQARYAPDAPTAHVVAAAQAAWATIESQITTTETT
ncbi:MAG: DUF4129 domain-containing protein [Caldilineaceae bacterium]|nr:DUF4129 domain-containing protein [Caldilineaceae bacterium]